MFCRGEYFYSCTVCVPLETWLGYSTLFSHALGAALRKGRAQPPPFKGGLCFIRTSSKLSSKSWSRGELKAVAMRRFESGWMGMCVSGAGEGEARGGGHSGALLSAVCGCCHVWEPAAERPFLGGACSVGLWYFEQIHFGSYIQNLVSLSQ